MTMFVKDPIDVDVKVTVLPGATPNYQFDSPIWQNNQLVFQNNGHNGFYVSFKIQPPKNPGDPQYYFPSDANKDLAVSAAPLVNPTDGCPPQNAAAWNQFRPDKVTDSNKTLIVHNPNAPGKQTLFGFTLFVTTNADGSGPYLALDPIGSNQDGPVSIDVWAVALAAVAVAAIALVVAYQFGLFAR